MIKNLSVVVKVFLYNSPGGPVIHDPRQVCVDLVNMNSRGLVPWNDTDFTNCFIKWSQLFLALFKAYRIYYQEFFIISKKYFSITIYFFTRGVDSQFAEISWIKYYKLMKGNSTRNDPVIIWYCPEDLNQQRSLSVLSFYNLFSGVWWMNRIYHTSGKFNGTGPPSTTSLSWIKLGNSLINRGLYT